MQFIVENLGKNIARGRKLKSLIVLPPRNKQCKHIGLYSSFALQSKLKKSNKVLEEIMSIL